jgi:hypothetical protein
MEENSLVLPAELEAIADLSGREAVDISQTDDQALALPAIPIEPVRPDVERAAGSDETRNCGEINRELLLRPEAEVVLGGAVRRCRPTAGFVRFLQPEAADPNRRTYRRASPRETKSGAPIVVANLVPTHDRGPGPPGGRSTWLLLSPNRSSVAGLEIAVGHSWFGTPPATPTRTATAACPPRRCSTPAEPT